MLNSWIKGTFRLKLKIHFMKSDCLIQNWRKIREKNESIIFEDDTDIDLKNEGIISNLKSEELLTGELQKRGLFEYAININFGKSKLKVITKTELFSNHLKYYT